MSTKQTPEIDPVQNERSGSVREVGSQAIWSLSSCKPGLFIEILYYKNTIEAMIIRFWCGTIKR